METKEIIINDTAEVVEKKEENTKAEKKTTTAKKTAAKTNTRTSKAATKNTKAASVKKYDMQDLIPCRSVTQGELILKSEKTGNQYYWGGYGDYCEVTYEDILFLKTRRSQFIFGPRFIIEDADIIADNAELKKVYDYYEKYNNLDDLYNMGVFELAAVLKEAPVGFRELVLNESIGRIKNGTLRDLGVINAIEKCMNINLKMYI